jgi:2-oxoglutarate ferredoxin oxidoreductase subunit delta
MQKESTKAKVTIFSESCKGMDDCGICKFVCPEDLFEACKEMNESGYYPPAITDLDECTGCQNCMICCPDYAIVVEKDEESPTRKKEDSDAAE